MKPYIFMEKNGIYIIDLDRTLKLLEASREEASRIAARGDEILYIGTKKQARDIIKAEAERAGMPYVNERWLGGMLTNFSTIRRSIKKLEALEKKVTDGTYEAVTKKERLAMDKERAKLERNLSGIRSMKRLPGAVFVVDTLAEEIAVREARKLGIPIFAIVDTNADPDPIDWPIPANDDAYKSIGLITKAFTNAVVEGAAVAQAKKAEEPEAKKGEEKKRSGGPRRRRGGGGSGDRKS
jgi:small subunit ribosomal protein S2